MSLLDKRNVYKPFNYPWAYEAFKQQNKMHWLPEEVPLREDVRDWNKNISRREKNLLTQIFRFFTQADVDVASGYLHKYIPIFGHQPELAMMMSTFAGMEAIHVDAYSTLLDTVGMPETEYEAFGKYTEMVDKHEYLETITVPKFKDSSKFKKKDLENIALSLAVYSAFTEGLQLFSSFIILLNFPRHGKMKGMGQIVTWSIRDESLHTNTMINLFTTFIKENPSIWKDSFKKKIYDACRAIVELEDSFIDLAFEQGGIRGLNAQQVKDYIRYIADRRLLQLGLKPNYKMKENPLEWVDEMLNSVEHANFFEARATEYNKGSVKGWDAVWDKYDKNL